MESKFTGLASLAGAFDQRILVDYEKSNLNTIDKANEKFKPGGQAAGIQTMNKDSWMTTIYAAIGMAKKIEIAGAKDPIYVNTRSADHFFQRNGIKCKDNDEFTTRITTMLTEARVVKNFAKAVTSSFSESVENVTKELKDDSLANEQQMLILLGALSPCFDMDNIAFKKVMDHAFSNKGQMVEEAASKLSIKETVLLNAIEELKSKNNPGYYDISESKIKQFLTAIPTKDASGLAKISLDKKTPNKKLTEDLIGIIQKLKQIDSHEGDSSKTTASQTVHPPSGTVIKRKTPPDSKQQTPTTDRQEPFKKPKDSSSGTVIQPKRQSTPPPPSGGSTPEPIRRQEPMFAPVEFEDEEIDWAQFLVNGTNLIQPEGRQIEAKRTENKGIYFDESKEGMEAFNDLVKGLNQALKVPQDSKTFRTMIGMGFSNMPKPGYTITQDRANEMFKSQKLEFKDDTALKAMEDIPDLAKVLIGKSRLQEQEAFGFVMSEQNTHFLVDGNTMKDFLSELRSTAKMDDEPFFNEIDLQGKELSKLAEAEDFDENTMTSTYTIPVAQFASFLHRMGFESEHLNQQEGKYLEITQVLSENFRKIEKAKTGTKSDWEAMAAFKLKGKERKPWKGMKLVEESKVKESAIQALQNKQSFMFHLVDYTNGSDEALAEIGKLNLAITQNDLSDIIEGAGFSYEQAQLATKAFSDAYELEEGQYIELDNDGCKGLADFIKELRKDASKKGLAVADSSAPVPMETPDIPIAPPSEKGKEKETQKISKWMYDGLGQTAANAKKNFNTIIKQLEGGVKFADLTVLKSAKGRNYHLLAYGFVSNVTAGNQNDTTTDKKVFANIMEQISKLDQKELKILKYIIDNEINVKKIPLTKRNRAKVEIAAVLARK